MKLLKLNMKKIMKNSLFKEIYWACKAAEQEWRANENYLQRQVDCLVEEKRRWLKLLQDPNISDTEFCNRLRTFYEL